MSEFNLLAPRQAEDILARAFLGSDGVNILVQEEKAFSTGKWLEMGTLHLFSAADEPDDLRAAVRSGSFEWRVPSQSDVEKQLRDLLGISGLADAKKKSAEGRLPGIYQGMAGIALRTGLSWPRFDAGMMSQMPFRRPATVVADTSGVLQGALSFVADYLHPTARVKIPALVHMEVINQADRFIKTWRTDGVRGEILLNEHVRSQPVQRALVRLEMRDDTEIERNALFGDPLRNAFREDNEAGLEKLNLNIPLKSYVDRMILEVARTHQSHASPGHEVYLLTADQGLAKMAIAEGVRPLFFRAMNATQLFGRTLVGALLHPFSGKRVSRPLTDLLWELATAFGRVKVRRGDADLIEIAAIGSDLGWSSYHSVEDLLWVRSGGLPSWPIAPSKRLASHIDDMLLTDAALSDPDSEPTAQAVPLAKSVSEDVETSSIPKTPPRAPAAAKNTSGGGAPRPTAGNKASIAFFRFTARGVVQLVDRLASEQRLPEEAIGEIVGISSQSGLSDYRKFLQSGGFVEILNGDWIATEVLVELADRQRARDIVGMRRLLERIPSFKHFAELVAGAPVGKGANVEIAARALPSYLGLGEVTGVGASISGEGYYATLTVPSVAEFAAIALKRFREIGPIDGLVAVGEWLEALVRRDGIHPVVARDLLQEANAANLIKRFTEGSTTNTRHDDHTLKVLQVTGGRVGVETIHLYRGDFLIPGKSSSSLRLEEAPR